MQKYDILQTKTSKNALQGLQNAENECGGLIKKMIVTCGFSGFFHYFCAKIILEMFHRINYIESPGCDIPDNLCFYIDNRDNEDINRFLKKNYDEVQEEFSCKGLVLIYLPMLSKNIGSEVMGYFLGSAEVMLNSHGENFKGMLPDEVCRLGNTPCIVHYDSLREVFEVASFVGPANDYPGLYLHTLVYEYSRNRRVSYVEDYLNERHNEDGVRFSMRRNARAMCNFSLFEPSDDACENAKLDSSCDSVAEAQFSFDFDDGIVEPAPEPERDKQAEALDNENQEMIEQVRALISKLRGRGIEEAVLKKLLAPVCKLSRLIITKDFRFLLADYDKEVKLTPMQKALLILYIKHPEGIAFKMLSDYKEELFDIYHEIDGWNFMRQRKRIDNICDPLRNTINENTSRIRNAFRAVVDDSIANNYYIRGIQGERMFVNIDRKLVEWG